ncbi:hypothetical protein, partial [Bacillus sp. AR18-7]|uniref:hypothetical protein n=1 Tax=Bacillus sp. AR18-7 TaxID=2217821 RepID=UPI0011CCAC47
MKSMFQNNYHPTAVQNFIPDCIPHGLKVQNANVQVEPQGIVDLIKLLLSQAGPQVQNANVQVEPQVGLVDLIKLLLSQAGPQVQNANV